MERNELITLVHTIMHESEGRMKANLEKVLDSGAVDLSSGDKRPYVLAETVFCALLKEEQSHYRPMYGRSKQISNDIDNIYYMI